MRARGWLVEVAAAALTAYEAVRRLGFASASREEIAKIVDEQGDKLKALAVEIRLVP